MKMCYYIYMKWDKKEKPKPGDVRFVKQFLFLPKCLKTIGQNDTLTCRWFETAFIKQAFLHQTTFGVGIISDSAGRCAAYAWKDLGWVEET